MSNSHYTRIILPLLAVLIVRLALAEEQTDVSKNQNSKANQGSENAPSTETKKKKPKKEQSKAEPSQPKQPKRKKPKKEEPKSESNTADKKDFPPATPPSTPPVEPQGKSQAPEKTDKPAADKPAADKPAADKPAADKPAADKPAEAKPQADAPPGDSRPKDKPAAADASTGFDADYWLQGEYLGEMGDGSSHHEAIGMQVVSLGEGKFQAMMYFGGLPGSGWTTGMGFLTLSGTSEAGKLTLKNETYEIVCMNNAAEVQHRFATLSGTLPRIERRSSTLNAPAPDGAVTLFDGKPNSLWKNAKISPDGLLLAGATTSAPVGDFHMHLEFRTPYKPRARGQDRGNSGVYIQTRYEIQILDSFGMLSQFNDGGSLYRQRAPDLNMCFAPMIWQTYDIWFRAARFDDRGEKTGNAQLTLWHNGVPVHNGIEISTKTGMGKPEGPTPLPLLLQDHGNAVEFRNIWIETGSDRPDRATTSS